MTSAGELHRGDPAGERLLQGGRVEAVGVQRDAHHLDRQRLEEVQQRREAGVLDDDPVAEPQEGPRHEVEGVHRAVDHGEPLGFVGPVTPEQLRQLREHRLLQIAARGAGTLQTGEHAAERGQQRLVGNTGRQVAPQRGRTIERPAVPPAVGRPCVQHGGAAASVGGHDPGAGEQAPRGRDRGGGEGQLPGDRANRRQLRAVGERFVGDGTAHRRGEST
jgi:hypothetical protein